MPVGGRHLEGAVGQQRHPEHGDRAHNGVRQTLPALQRTTCREGLAVDSSAIQNTVTAPTMESAKPSQPCSACRWLSNALETAALSRAR